MSTRRQQTDAGKVRRATAREGGRWITDSWRQLEIWEADKTGMDYAQESVHLLGVAGAVRAMLEVNG